MKNSFLALMAICLITFSHLSAQNKSITAEKATAYRGYTVINKGEPITIYKYQHASHSPKEAEKYAPKYFFIINGSETLQPLTKMNLKKAFPDNHPFHDALDANFEEDKELIGYDDFHKMYKVSWLLKENTK